MVWVIALFITIAGTCIGVSKHEDVMKQEQYRRVVAENRLKMSKAAHSKKLSNTNEHKLNKK